MATLVKTKTKVKTEDILDLNPEDADAIEIGIPEPFSLAGMRLKSGTDDDKKTDEVVDVETVGDVENKEEEQVNKEVSKYFC